MGLIVAVYVYAGTNQTALFFSDDRSYVSHILIPTSERYNIVIIDNFVTKIKIDN